MTTNNILFFGICFLLVLLVFRNIDKKLAVGVLQSLALLIVLYLLQPGITAYLGFIALGYIAILQIPIRKTLRQFCDWTNFVIGNSNYKNPEKKAADVLVDTVKQLSDTKTGAIIALIPQGEDPDSSVLSGGTVINGELSSDLILTIFSKGTALHDGIVLVSGPSVIKASCVATSLPNEKDLPSEFEDNHLGTRHRAAWQISFIYKVITVSEETGDVHIMENGEMNKVNSEDELKECLDVMD